MCFQVSPVPKGLYDPDVGEQGDGHAGPDPLPELRLLLQPGEAAVPRHPQQGSLQEGRGLGYKQKHKP